VLSDILPGARNKPENRREKTMELDAAKMVGAGLAVIGLGGVGAGIGNIFSSLIGSIARNPAARGQVFGLAMLGFALVEAVALYALLISFLILFT
jgi:F-type H+-transporting ATPase subunit c